MNILKQVRTSMHINQEQLAQYLGYSLAYISLTENEQENLPTGCWVKLLKLYNLINKIQKGAWRGKKGDVDYRRILSGNSCRLTCQPPMMKAVERQFFSACICNS